MTTNLNVRVDAGLKKEAEELFSYLGLTMTSAISIFLRSAVDNNGIPFAIKKPQVTIMNDNDLLSLSDSVIQDNLEAYEVLAK